MEYNVIQGNEECITGDNFEYYYNTSEEILENEKEMSAIGN